MSKNKLAFFGWSKFGQEIYLYDSPTHEIKYVHEKVDGNLSEPLDGDELADSIYYDMSDAYQEIAKAYLMKNGRWDNTYTGTFTNDYGTWNIVNGMVQ